jgi:GT2 family glycosyltransferase
VKKSRTGGVSVVVVNWNRRELLRACLQSLGRQNVNHVFQVVLVDNGSTDSSVEMAEREFANETAFQLKVIRNLENRGFCAANNQAFAAVDSEFVALLNNDAEADAGWVAALAGVLEKKPEAGMAASKILVHEHPSTIDKAGHLIYPDGQNRGRGSGEPDIGQYDRVEEVLWPDGCAAMYRGSMLDEIGGFDEDFFAYADDAELGLRARIAGWTCVYTPHAKVLHHRGATLGVGSSRRLELIERNRILLVAKLFPWSLIWLNGIFFAMRLGAGLWAAIRNKGEVANYPGVRGKLQAALAIVKGDFEALPMIPRMLQKRREIEKIRKLSPSEVKHLLMRHRISLKQLAEQAAP